MFFLGSGETCIETEIDRNWRSEELLKLGGGQKISFLGGGRDLPYEGEVRKFSFSGDACPMRGVIF